MLKKKLVIGLLLLFSGSLFADAVPFVEVFARKLVQISPAKSSEKGEIFQSTLDALRHYGLNQQSNKNEVIQVISNSSQLVSTLAIGSKLSIEQFTAYFSSNFSVLGSSGDEERVGGAQGL